MSDRSLFETVAGFFRSGAKAGRRTIMEEGGKAEEDLQAKALGHDLKQSRDNNLFSGETKPNTKRSSLPGGELASNMSVGDRWRNLSPYARGGVYLGGGALATAGIVSALHGRQHRTPNSELYSNPYGVM
jgi:hypothetical protein